MLSESQELLSGAHGCTGLVGRFERPEARRGNAEQLHIAQVGFNLEIPHPGDLGANEAQLYALASTFNFEPCGGHGSPWRPWLKER